MQSDVSPRRLLQMQTPTREFPASRGKWKKKDIVFDDLPNSDPTSAVEDGTATAKEFTGVGGATSTVTNPAAYKEYIGGNAKTIAGIKAEKTCRKTSPVRRIVDRTKEEENSMKRT